MFYQYLCVCAVCVFSQYACVCGVRVSFAVSCVVSVFCVCVSCACTASALDQIGGRVDEGEGGSEGKGEGGRGGADSESGRAAETAVASLSSFDAAQDTQHD